MILYRNHIPLLPAEELGYHLGLVVPPDDKNLFYDVRISDSRPPAGYGTQIQDPAYNPNVVFRKLGIPLSFRIISSNEIKDADDLLLQLRNVLENDGDAGLCLDWNVLHDKGGGTCGHLVLFDRIIGDKIRIIDPESNQPKWQLFDIQILYKALKKHAPFSGGIWLFNRAGRQ